MDKTMEAENTPDKTIEEPELPQIELNKNVSSIDFLREYITKEGFGKTTGCMFMVLLVLVLLIAVVYYFNKSMFLKVI